MNTPHDPGPLRLPGASPPAARPIHEVLADPATTEAAVPTCGIHSVGALAAATSRPNKSPTLVKAILAALPQAWVSYPPSRPDAGPAAERPCPATRRAAGHACAHG